MARPPNNTSHIQSFSSSPDLIQLPSFTKFKIGICQLTVSAEKSQNLIHARSLIEAAAKQGAKLVLLPEIWVCPYSHNDIVNNAEDFDDNDGSPTLAMLSEVAASHRITVIGGSLPERCNGRLYNSCPVFGSDGKLICKHRKVHLFDADFSGEFSFMESDIFAAGDKPTVVDTEMGRVGIGICHDIRFPQLATFYRDKGVCLIAYPGAFNMSTGESLWELLQRARAADNQLFVATCSPSRDSKSSYTIWGHSTLVGPCGEIIATSGHEENVVIAEIDYLQIQIQRNGLPLFKQGREDVYSQYKQPNQL